MRKSVVFTILVLNLFSCNQSSQQPSLNSEPNSTLKYARGFNIDYKNGFKKITVTRLFNGSAEKKTYYLYNEGTDVSVIPGDGQQIMIPLQKIVCSSTTHLPSLELIGEVESLVGFPSVEYISSQRVRDRIAEGQVTDLGSENGMDIERIVNLSPDILMGFLMTGDSKVYNKIENSGIPVVINSDYLENTPLGRAEWIKFVAAFFNKEQVADSIFDAIEENYHSIKESAAKISSKPAVFSGILYGGTWYMPGGESFASIFLNDAGGDFLWSDNVDTGSLELSFETVLERAQHADYWIGASNFKSKSDMLQSDDRYELFTAFKNDQVYTYTLNVTENGGNDFFETGYARPDWILSDLVKILHPGMLEDEDYHFYQKIK